MSDKLMNLWDYRQAQYCDAAKWVCGDIGKPDRYETQRAKPHENGRCANAQREQRSQGAVLQRRGVHTVETTYLASYAGTYAHHVYALRVPKHVSGSPYTKPR